MNSVIETIRFLVVNELASRGNWDSDLGREKGLFTSLFEYTMKINQKLKDYSKSMPKNATYTCPSIQNQIISVMAKLTRDEIVKDVNSADFFTLFADGTKDKNKFEIISLACRYIKDGKPYETLLGFDICMDLHAEPMTNFMLSLLDQYGIKKNKMLSQCYDGASVMSGDKGGIQKIIQRKLNKNIPYVHCFNHRLHLVIIATIRSVQMASNFFDQLRMIYNFLSRHKVKQFYEGNAILKTIDIRWSGHLRATKSVFSNYSEIIKTLIQINPTNLLKFDGEDIAQAIGILKVIQGIEFVFMLHLMKDLLEIIEPVNKILQSRESGYSVTLPLIDSVIDKIKGLKFDHLLVNTVEFISLHQVPIEPRPRRNRQQPQNLEEYEVSSILRARDEPVLEAKDVMKQVIEKFLSELKARFTENSAILISLSSVDEFNKSNLEPLVSLGIELPEQSELDVAKEYIKKKKDEWIAANTKETESKEIFNILNALYPVREAFPKTYKLFCAVATFGSSNAINESSFSCLARLQTVKRMSMREQRLCDLAFLAFEHKHFEKISNDTILNKFSEANRRAIF